MPQTKLPDLGGILILRKARKHRWYVSILAHHPMALRIHTEEIAHHRHPASSPQVWGEGQRERWCSADGQSAKGSRGIAWRVLEKPLYAAQSPSKRSSRHMGAANTYSNRDKQPRYEIQNSGRTCFFRQGPSRAALSTPVFKLSCISYFELLHSRMRSCPGPGPCGFERQCSVSMTSLANVPLAVVPVALMVIWDCRTEFRSARPREFTTPKFEGTQEERLGCGKHRSGKLALT